MAIRTSIKPMQIFMRAENKPRLAGSVSRRDRKLKYKESASSMQIRENKVIWMANIWLIRPLGEFTVYFIDFNERLQYSIT